MKLHKTSAWQTALSQAITDPNELLRLLELDSSLLEPARHAAKLFPLRVPRSFLARIKKGDPHDPLLKQVLPLGIEATLHPNFSTDPLGEAKVNPVSGLLHKYQSRVLLTLVSACGINCRYCFRRHFAYEQNNPGTNGWENALNYIAQDPSIKEVILSGGDPLIASDHLLALFTDKLKDIPHIKRLRIHSRMPIAMPERITPSFLEWISQLPFKTILVTHTNHPQEIDSPVKTAIKQLQTTGITLLNQSVLLRGVNDNVETLIELSETLFEIGILPYYLHLLDKVQGAAHFDVEKETALALHQELTQRLSGFLVPRLVYEMAGAPAKLIVTN